MNRNANDIDSRIANNTGLSQQHALDERTALVNARQAQLAAIDALWTDHGIDVDDIRQSNGSLSMVDADGHRVRTQSNIDYTGAYLSRQSTATDGRAARTRRWFKGADHVEPSHEQALLEAIRAGFVKA